MEKSTPYILDASQKAVWDHLYGKALKEGLRLRYDAREVARDTGKSVDSVKLIVNTLCRSELMDRVQQSVLDIHLPPDQREHDLAGANLAGARLRGIDFRGANLAGADLSNADLVGANLFAANLREANLAGADFSEACLSRADLHGANLKEARGYGCDLTFANLETTDLTGFTKNDMLDHRHGTLGARVGGNLRGWRCIANDPPTIAQLLRRQLRDLPEHQMVLSRILSIDGIRIGCWNHGLEQIGSWFKRGLMQWAAVWASDTDTDIYARFQLFHQLEILRFRMADDEPGMEAYFERMEQLAPDREWRVFFKRHQARYEGRLGNIISPTEMFEITGHYNPWAFENNFRFETLPQGRPRLPQVQLDQLESCLAEIHRPGLLQMGQWMRQASNLSKITLETPSKIQRLEDHPSQQKRKQENLVVALN